MKKWLVMVWGKWDSSWHLDQWFDWKSDAEAHIRRKQVKNRDDAYRLLSVLVEQAEPRLFPAPEKQPATAPSPAPNEVEQLIADGDRVLDEMEAPL